MTIGGSYAQGSTGVLNVVINGPTPGTQYSQIKITNGATLDGTLNILRRPGFIPVIGKTFQILTAGGGVSGTWATVNGTQIDSTRHFVVHKVNPYMNLDVVAGP